MLWLCRRVVESKEMEEGCMGDCVYYTKAINGWCLYQYFRISVSTTCTNRGGGGMGSNYRVIAVSTHTVLYQVHDSPPE